MKALYYLSFLLFYPFYVVSWIGAAVALICESIGDILHDYITVPIWDVMHKRECAKLRSERGQKP